MLSVLSTSIIKRVYRHNLQNSLDWSTDAYWNHFLRYWWSVTRFFRYGICSFCHQSFLAYRPNDFREHTRKTPDKVPLCTTNQYQDLYVFQIPEQLHNKFLCRKMLECYSAPNSWYYPSQFSCFLCSSLCQKRSL